MSTVTLPSDLVPNFCLVSLTSATRSGMISFRRSLRVCDAGEWRRPGQRRAPHSASSRAHELLVRGLLLRTLTLPEA